MHLTVLPAAQDTTVVALASDTLTLAPGWIGALVATVSVALLVALLLVLLELRRVGNTLAAFLATTEERTRPLVEHANAAARNVEHITQVVRTDLDRINEAFKGLAGGVGDASGELQKRLRDLLALLDLAQSEAEDAVLEAAAKVRAFRSGMGLLRWPRPDSAQMEDPGAESDGSGASSPRCNAGTRPRTLSIASLWTTPPRHASGDASALDRFAGPAML